MMQTFECARGKLKKKVSAADARSACNKAFPPKRGWHYELAGARDAEVKVYSKNWLTATYVLIDNG